MRSCKLLLVGDLLGSPLVLRLSLFLPFLVSLSSLSWGVCCWPNWFVLILLRPSLSCDVLHGHFRPERAGIDSAFVFYLVMFSANVLNRPECADIEVFGMPLFVQMFQWLRVGGFSIVHLTDSRYFVAVRVFWMVGLLVFLKAKGCPFPVVLKENKRVGSRRESPIRNSHIWRFSNDFALRVL